MRRKEMAQLIRRYLVRLNILARKIAARYKEEDIHAFRVEIKKLRAFIRLVSPAGKRRSTPVNPLTGNTPSLSNELHFD
jgi:CHAD domain-containing protein